jgi:hypothetical protein
MIFLGVALAIIVIQDFKERKVSVMLLLIILFMSTALFIRLDSASELPRRFILNSVFSLMILVSGTLMVRLRRPKKTMSSIIGTGDFLFLISISPLFSFEAYLVFLYTSFLFILAVFGIILAIRRNRDPMTIPLAGGQAIYLILILVINELISFDLFSMSFLQMIS